MKTLILWERVTRRNPGLLLVGEGLMSVLKKIHVFTVSLKSVQFYAGNG